MNLKLAVLIDTGVLSAGILKDTSFLRETFWFETIYDPEVVSPPVSCLNRIRQQYQANCLLAYVNQHRRRGLALLVVSQDMFNPGFNFIFGIGAKGQAAVVSTFRLQNDPEFLRKEIIHELGHVFGLKHCSPPCVMTYSNSVQETRFKTSEFCEACKRLLVGQV
ncbi:MAG: hypothetical protein ACFFFG_14225 [Candidatus Thorarchaeota archaeon]